MLEQNLEIHVTMVPTPDVNTYVLYNGARPKRNTVTALPLQQQPGDETHDVPPSCAPRNAHYTWAATQVDGKQGSALPLRAEAKPPPCIKPKKPARINDLVSASSNTLNSFLALKHIQELCSKITPDDHTFQSFHIVNQHLWNAGQQVQKYRDLITEFKEQQIIYYCNIYILTRILKW